MRGQRRQRVVRQRDTRRGGDSIWHGNRPIRAATGVPSAGVFGTALAGVRVYFGGIAAPLLTVGDDRVSAVVPFELAPQSTVAVQVERDGVRSDPIQVPFAAIAPAIFQSGTTNRALVLNEDQSVNSPTNPAKRGSVITFRATGLGAMQPSVVDGLVTRWAR